MSGPRSHLQGGVAQQRHDVHLVHSRMNGFHDPDRMYMERFGDIHVFRPRLETELAVRAGAEQHLRARFNVGRYANKNEINAILGEHLISDQAVGVIELVKNSYDADATEVTVELLNLESQETAMVVVTDNGSGMSLTDVTEKWLSPAVDHKEQRKRNQIRTRLGRLPIGEKRVGRFAGHQIGRQLELVTRQKTGAEVVLKLNWDDFENGSRFLDEVQVDVQERSPQVFTGNRSGTRLTIPRSRSAWDKRLVQKVHRALRRQKGLADDFIRDEEEDLSWSFPGYACHADL